MTATITEYELTELTEEELAIPCDGVPCDDTATWSAITKCCGNSWLFCEDCLDFQKGLDADPYQWWTCGKCENTVRAPIILRYEKL